MPQESVTISDQGVSISFIEFGPFEFIHVRAGTWAIAKELPAHMKTMVRGDIGYNPEFRGTASKDSPRHLYFLATGAQNITIGEYLGAALTAREITQAACDALVSRTAALLLTEFSTRLRRTGSTLALDYEDIMSLCPSTPVTSHETKKEISGVLEWVHPHQFSKYHVACLAANVALTENPKPLAVIHIQQPDRKTQVRAVFADPQRPDKNIEAFHDLALLLYSALVELPRLLQ